MPMAYLKDPAAKLDYYIDWSAWLATDTIVSSTWTAVGSVTLSNPSVSGHVTGIWVAGGVLGEATMLTNHVVTAAGREDERTLQLIMRQR